VTWVMEIFLWVWMEVNNFWYEKSNFQIQIPTFVLKMDQMPKSEIKFHARIIRCSVLKSETHHLWTTRFLTNAKTVTSVLWVGFVCFSGSLNSPDLFTSIVHWVENENGPYLKTWNKWEIKHKQKFYKQNSYDIYIYFFYVN